MATKSKSKAELASWVRQAIKSGKSEVHIRRQLKKYGWKVHDINEAFPKARFDFTFVLAIVVSLGLFGFLYLAGSPFAVGFGEAAITGHASSNFPINEQIDLRSRVDPKLPANWFVKTNHNAEPTDDAKWEWDSLRNGALVLDLARMYNPAGQYETPRLNVYSRVLGNFGTGRHNISLSYKPEFMGECVYLGFEVLFPDGSSDTTWSISLNETGVANSMDFEASQSVSSGWVKIVAGREFDVPEDRNFQFVFSSLCDKGRAHIKDLAIS